MTYGPLDGGIIECEVTEEDVKRFEKAFEQDCAIKSITCPIPIASAYSSSLGFKFYDSVRKIMSYLTL